MQPVRREQNEFCHRLGLDWLAFVADIAFKAVVATDFAALLIPATGLWQTPLAIMVSSVFAALQLRSIALGAKIQQLADAALALRPAE